MPGVRPGICCRKAQDSRRQHVVPYTERVRAEACGNIELSFYDLLDQLHTGHDAPGVELVHKIIKGQFGLPESFGTDPFHVWYNVLAA